MDRSCWRELGINRSRFVFWAAARWNVEARFARFATKELRALSLCEILPFIWREGVVRATLVAAPCRRLAGFAEGASAPV